jgi:hypothetical protein
VPIFERGQQRVQCVDRDISGVNFQLCFETVWINDASAWAETQRTIEIYRSRQTQECLNDGSALCTIVIVHSSEEKWQEYLDYCVRMKKSGLIHS